MEIREGHNKFYINDEQGKQIAEIVFVPTGENLAIIEHTDVDESLKGQGMIFAVDGRVQSHDIFHALRGVMQESI
ncbi:hypothetical protein LL293_002441 [Escherichia coli]|nr:hypothetical protein [Escherichia coli]EHP5307956.1 hypothetical protein [Escherichia coli]EIL5833405.1 hypothetical protein [Escherichia coli]HBU8082088.1 hypothetical protein [Escherichia coli]